MKKLQVTILMILSIFLWVLVYHLFRYVSNVQAEQSYISASVEETKENCITTCLQICKNKYGGNKTND